jgi:hypothetical protein
MATVLLLVGPARVTAQEPVPVDTVRADTIRADTTIAVSDSVRQLLDDAPTRERVQAFPDRYVGAGAESELALDCDLDCILDSPAFTLVELLMEKVPGFTTVRAGYFGGQHYGLHGPFGPGFTRVLLDGRELPSMEAGASDVLRISLVYVERVRVYRRPDGFVIDVSGKRQAERTAYSRITGGTGSPRVQLLNAIFANRLGRAFTLGAAFDLLDSTIPTGKNDTFDFWGRFSWMPGSNDTGIQFDYRNQSMNRSAADTAQVGRQEMLLRGRLNLTEMVQIEALVNRASLKKEDSLLRRVDQVGFEARATPGRGALAMGVQFLSGDAYAKIDGHLTGGYRITEQIMVDAEARYSKWDAFTTSELRVAAQANVRLGVPLTLRADAATGTRGVPRPSRETADSVSFDAFSGSLEAVLGPFGLTGRYSVQNLGREVPFVAAFDSLLADGPSVDVSAWELGLTGPVLPLSWISSSLDPIRIAGSWRRHLLTPGQSPLYVPQDLMRGQVMFHNTFFAGNLEVWLTGKAEHRSATVSAQCGNEEMLILPSYTWFGGHLMIKIGDFRLFYKLENPTGVQAGEVGGVLFPASVSVFGVRWEFFN